MKTARIVFVILAALLVMAEGVWAISEETAIIAEGECGAEGNNLTWTLNSDGLLTIIGSGDMYYDNTAPWSSYSNSIKTLLINEGITSIEESAFSHCSELSSVVLPDSLQYIKSYSFNLCTSLTELAIPNNVMVNHSAFYGCTSLARVSLPAHILDYEPGRCNYCQSGFECIFGSDVSLSEISLTGSSIPDYALYSYESIEKITLSDSITSIGNSAFQGCISLNSINIPTHLEDIGEYAFSNCKSLTKISLPNTVKYIYSGAFGGCSNLKTVELPNSIISLHDTFARCTSLESIILPNSITSIGQYTFEYCRSLTSINIPVSVAYIGNSAFNECTSLKNVYFYCTILPDIDLSAFTKCTPTIHCYKGSEIDTWAAGQNYRRVYDLVAPAASLILPANTTTIGEEAFAGTNIQKVVLSDKCTTIGSRAFADCADLVVIYMPDSVTSIATSAFDGCYGFKFICESNNAAAAFAETNGIYWEIE